MTAMTDNDRHTNQMTPTATDPSPTIRALALVTAYSAHRPDIIAGPWAEICAEEITADPVGIVYGLCTLAAILAGLAAAGAGNTTDDILALVGTLAAANLD